MVKKGFKLQVNSESLISFSLLLFITLLFLPITITMNGLIRKSLLIIGLLSFLLALLVKHVKFLLYYFAIIFVLLVYYYSSWIGRVDFSSYVFNMLISAESLILSIMVSERKIVISQNVLYYLIIIVGVTAVTTSIGLFSYPLAVRQLAQGTTDETLPIMMMYRKQNIAGWGLIFGMAFIEGPILHLYKEKKNFFLLIIAIINGLCVVLSQLAFAILFLFILVFLVYINGKNKSIILRTVPIFLLFIFIWFNRAAILMAVYDFLGNFEQLSVAQLRVKNIYDLLVLHSSEGDAGARFELYMRSFNSFLNHPFGLLVEGIDSNYVLGFHSEFFDFLGAMGISGPILIFVLLRILYRNVKHSNNIYEMRFMIITSSTFFLCFILNPVISHPYIWITALLVPAHIACSSEGNEKL